MLDLAKLRTFQVVAATCNFNRAGIQLGYSQSSVTMHIKALERELGVRLLNRSRFSRNVALTEAGRQTLDYADRLLALADETVLTIQ
jgi:DNA-binding transcriptional LysR family regulator